jgi:hypothetical protein
VKTINLLTKRQDIWMFKIACCFFSPYDFSPPGIIFTNSVRLNPRNKTTEKTTL